MRKKTVYLEGFFKNSVIFLKICQDLTQSNRYSGTQEEQIVNQFLLNEENGKRCKKGYMTYTPQHIANYFLDVSDHDNRPITQMKLHKLVYIAYGWYLALTNDKLFNDRIEAWEHGPVIKGLREEFKNFGRDPITVKSIGFDWETLEESEPRIPSDDNDTHAVLEKVWESYKKFSAATLRNKTHEKGSPWYLAYDGGAGYGVEIDDEEIKQHYKERIAKYLEAARQIN